MRRGFLLAIGLTAFLITNALQAQDLKMRSYIVTDSPEVLLHSYPVDPIVEEMGFHFHQGPFYLSLGSGKPPLRFISSVLEGPLETNKDLLSEWIFSLGFALDSIHGQENSSGTVLVGELQPSIGLEWHQNWNTSWSTFFALNFSSRSYEGSASSLTSLDQRTETQGRFSFGGIYKWGRSSSLRFGLGANEALYYQQTSENVYNLIKDTHTFAQTLWTHNLFHKESLFFSGQVQLQYSLAGSKDFQGGFDYAVGPHIKHQYSQDSAFSGSLLYQQGQFETTWYKYDQRQWLLQLNYHVGF